MFENLISIITDLLAPSRLVDLLSKRKHEKRAKKCEQIKFEQILNNLIEDQEKNKLDSLIKTTKPFALLLSSFPTLNNRTTWQVLGLDQNYRFLFKEKVTTNAFIDKVELVSYLEPLN